MRLLKWLKKRNKKTSEIITAYKTVFSGYEGELVLADLCRHCFIDRNSFNPENMYITAHNEGRRAVANHILTMMSLNQNEFINDLYIKSGEINNED